MNNTLWAIRKWLYRIYYRQIYLRSPHWRKFRQQMLCIAGYQCEVDGCMRTKRLDVHHLTYENIGHEKRGDALVLCRFHHRMYERGVKYRFRPRKTG